MQVVGFNLMRWELFKVTEFIKPMVWLEKAPTNIMLILTTEKSLLAILPSILVSKATDQENTKANR